MEKNNTIVKDAIVLFIITIVAGLCLAFVYELTKEPIAAAQLKAKNDAYREVLPEASEFIEDEEIAGLLASYEADGAQVTEVLLAKDGAGETLGCVASVTGTEGYGGDISMTVGVSLEGTITGIQVLSHSETAGLGAKCTDDEFRGQFVGIQANPVIMNQNFDQISGATITSSAVTKAVNAVVSFAAEYENQ